MRRGADLIEAFDEGSARYRQLAFTPHGGAIGRDLCLCAWRRHAAGGRRRASDDEYMMSGSRRSKQVSVG
jgi:hypothetical protein